LQPRDFTVTTISTFAQLNSLIQNPPNFSLVINCHGEIMPVPPGTAWNTFYINLGTVVMNSGWALLNIGGYPFWYQANGNAVRDAGLNAFLSPSNMQGNCMNAGNSEFTETGREVVNRMNLTGALPHALPIARCAIWRHISQSITFLGSRNLAGMSAIRMGRGWFVHLGVDSSLGTPGLPPAVLSQNDTTFTNLAVGSALYAIDKL